MAEYYESDPAVSDLPSPNGNMPFSADAEVAVLGALLLNPSRLLEVDNSLRESYFLDRGHRAIYAGLLSLRDSGLGIDPISLANHLREQDRLADLKGGAPYLNYLIEQCPTSVNVVTYARIVERKALLRLLMQAADKIKGLAQDEKEDVEEILDRAEKEIFKISQDRVIQDLTPIARIVPRVWEEMQLSGDDASSRRLPIGFTQLDQLLGGFSRSDLLILAGRPGMGKSSLGLTFVHYTAMQLNAKVAIFSLEMSKEQLVQRMLAMETNTNLSQIRTGELEEYRSHLMEEAMHRIQDTDIYIDDTPAASVGQIRGKARRLHAEINLDLIVIDYMQLMSGSDASGTRTIRENRQQEITFISSSIKNLARELEVPVLALSQLSRAVEARQDKRPMLQDLRESGSIEQDADVVMFLYRDDYYNEDSLEPNLAELIVAKHRNGSTGKVQLFFHKELTLFRELEFNAMEPG